MSFKATNYLLFDQSNDELDNELLAEFNPWMTTKTFSFYEGGCLCDYINDTLNMYGNLFPNKEDQFRFFENAIPKNLPKRRIKYIKNPKKKKEDEQPVPEFYSKRELAILEDVSKYIHERTTASID